MKKTFRPFPVPPQAHRQWLAGLGGVFLGLLAAAGVMGPQAALSGPRLELPLQTVAPGEARLTIRVGLPSGYRPMPESPSQAKVSSGDVQVLALGQEGGRIVNPALFPLELTITARPGETRLTLDLLLYYCKADQGGLCLFKEVSLVLPVRVAPEATGRTLEAAYTLTGP